MIGDELWAWQVEEQPDVWGMVGAMLPGPEGMGMHTPLIHRSRETVDKMKPMADKHATATGLPLRLARFTLTETLP